MLIPMPPSPSGSANNADSVIDGSAEGLKSLPLGGMERSDAGSAQGRRPRDPRLLDLDRRPGSLELVPGRLGLLFRNPLQDGLRGAVLQVLGLLQAQARERANLLDHLDLLLPGRLKDHVELGLLLDLLGGRRATAGRRGAYGHGGRGLDPELLLDLLGQIGRLDDRELLDRVQDVVHGKLRHVRSSLVRPPSSAYAAASCRPRSASAYAKRCTGACSRYAIRARGA